MKKRLLVFLLSLAPSVAFAQGVGQHVTSDVKTLLSGVACNASAGARTFTLSPAGAGFGYGMGIFQVDFTYNAATAVALACEASINNQTSWATLQSCSVSSGTCTSSDASWSKATSASDTWLWRVDFLGAPDVKCTVSCTGGGASDTFTVYGRLATL